jgi:hypothetical protein
MTPEQLDRLRTLAMVSECEINWMGEDVQALNILLDAYDQKVKQLQTLQAAIGHHTADEIPDDVTRACCFNDEYRAGEIATLHNELGDVTTKLSQVLRWNDRQAQRISVLERALRRIDDVDAGDCTCRGYEACTCEGDRMRTIAREALGQKGESK